MLDIKKIQSTNTVTIIGTLNELNIEEKTTADGRAYVHGTANVKVDQEINGTMVENIIPVRMFSMRLKKDKTPNAVYDGTSVVMLSGETASGKYPIEAVKQMSTIAEETEHHINYQKRFDEVNFHLQSITDVISHSAVNASFLQRTKALVVFTDTGESARMVSRFRPVNPILACTPNEIVYRQLELSWGVLPMHTPMFDSSDKMFKFANDFVKDKKLANTGNTIVITCGTPKQPGCTNLIKIQKVD